MLRGITERPVDTRRALFIFCCLAASMPALGAEAARTPSRDEVVETQLLPRAVKQSVQRLGRAAPDASKQSIELRPAQRIDTARRLIQAVRASGDRAPSICRDLC